LSPPGGRCVGSNKKIDMKLERHLPALGLAVCCGSALAQGIPPVVTSGVTMPAPAVAAPTENSFQLIGDSQRLTNGYGNWEGLTARGTWRIGPSDLLQGELSASRRFGTKGVFASIGDTHTFNEDWFGSLAFGAGDGAFYLPRYRIDATLSRKFLEKRQLVGTVGAGYYRAPDGHTDRTLLLSAAYYFDFPLVLEGGVRFNSSNPGSVDTRQQFVAGTWGRVKSSLFTARYAWGGEGYLATTAASQLVNFRSREASVGYQHWITPTAGVIVGALQYRNPLYRRTGVNVGFFHEF